MKEFFRWDGPLMRFLNSVADMILLSMLWAVFSLPVVTMGASTAALYSIIMRYSEDDTMLLRRFWQAFRENLKRGCAAGLIFTAYAALLVLGIPILNGMEADSPVLRIAVWVSAFFCASICVYTFPLLSQFDQKLMQTMKNALIISMCNLPSTLLVLLIHAIPLFTAIVNPDMFLSRALPFLSFMGAGTIALLSGWVIKRVLRKYIPQTES